MIPASFCLMRAWETQTKQEAWFAHPAVEANSTLMNGATHINMIESRNAPPKA